ncbi:hypothetical protein IAR50_006195 [Cryptococcus sp. DSM 104548]
MPVSRLNGALSPPLQAPRSGTPRPRFPVDSLRSWTKDLLASTLTNVSWDPENKAKMREVGKGISDKIKSRMVELEPNGFKYIVQSTLTENLGQGGRGDMACHWEEGDVAVQEMFSNDTLIFFVIAYAVRFS